MTKILGSVLRCKGRLHCQRHRSSFETFRMPHTIYNRMIATTNHPTLSIKETIVLSDLFIRLNTLSLLSASKSLTVIKNLLKISALLLSKRRKRRQREKKQTSVMYSRCRMKIENIPENSINSNKK